MKGIEKIELLEKLIDLEMEVENKLAYNTMMRVQRVKELERIEQELEETTKSMVEEIRAIKEQLRQVD